MRIPKRLLVPLIGLLLACSDDNGGGVVGNNGNGNGDGAWQLIGGAVSENYAFFPSLALDGSDPVVAWTDFDRTRYNVYVKRWDGSEWVQLGGALNTSPGIRAQGNSLTIDGSGRPVVAWYEEEVGNWNVYVKRWEGSDWTQLGGALDLVYDAEAYGATIIADGDELLVGWIEDGNAYVKRWNGSSWVQLGDTLNMFREYDPGGPSIAIDASGRPVVALPEATGYDCDVYVWRWEDPDWVQIGSGVDPKLYGGSFAPSLDVGPSGDLFVAYEDYKQDPHSNVFVSRWTGSIWEQLGTAVADPVAGAWNPSMAVEPTESPVVACRGGSAGVSGPEMSVKRWYGSSWIQLGEALDVDPSGCAVNPSLALDPLGNPVVAWSEYPLSDSNCRVLYVKRLNIQP